jgi:SAM-dependent methyltransferase
MPPPASTATAESKPKAKATAKAKAKESYKTKRFHYDHWVLGIVSTYAWGCPTSRYTLPQYRANIGENHLDIGIATGYYLRHGGIPLTTNITVVDTNKPAMEYALERLGRRDARAIVADILKPLPIQDKFDSVSMYYLLNCIPAGVEHKCAVFSHIRNNMTPNGVIHGASIVGKGVRVDNKFAARMRGKLLAAGIFQNKEDSPFDFEKALRQNFHEVEVRVVGTVFLFRAACPRLDDADATSPDS